MTRRHAEKGATRRSAARGARPVPVHHQPNQHDGSSIAPAVGDGVFEASEIEHLKQEREALTAEVEALRRRVSELETNAAQVRNRLAWAIDSVQSLLDGKG